MKLLYFFFIFSVCISAQWQSVVPYPTLNDIIYIKAFSENEFIMCTSASGWSPPGFEIFKTEDAGKTWKSISKFSGSYLYKAFFLDRMHGWATSKLPYSKFWRTTDGGLNWDGYDLPGSYNFNEIFFLNENTGFLSTSTSLLKSIDGGESWNVLYTDSIGGFWDLSVLNENFIACAGNAIRITTDGGINWSLYSDSTLHNGFDGVYFVDSLSGYAMDNYLIWMKTTDGGKNWEKVVNWNWSEYGYADALFHNNTGVIAYGAYECCAALYITTDHGENWVEKSVDVHPKSLSFINDSTFILAGDNGLIYKSTDFGNTFNIAGERFYGMWGLSFSKEGYGYINSHYVFHTSNNGETFIKTDRPPMKEMAAIGDSIIIGMGINKILRSTNKGLDWNEIEISPSPGQMWNFSFPTDTTGCFTAHAGIYKTTDAGASWAHISSMRQRAINFVDEETGFVVNNHIYKTTDGGISWQQQANGYYGSISMLDNNTGAAGFDKIYYTYDGGENWQQAVVNGIGTADELWDIEVFNYNGIIIGYAYFFNTGRLFYSVDNLKTWNIDKDFPFIREDEFDKIPFLQYDGKTLWAGTVMGFLLKRNNFDDLITSADESGENKIPSEYILMQNYPNPFNPTSTFKFSLPQNEFVTLKIYDILGNEIAQLVNEEKPAGEYQFQWDASDFSSGVYFYRLQAGEFISTKKLLLMK